MHASYCPVDFQTAYHKATRMQQESPISYGPFRTRASNCSRFVNTVILSGKPAWKFRFRLKYLIPLTPTPMNNVNSLDDQMLLPDMSEHIPFYPIKKLDNQSLRSTLRAPPRNSRIPENAQWLGGEGAGSWFDFEIQNSQFLVTRYSPDGVVECTGLFKNHYNQGSIPDNSFQITHPSNCKVVSLAYKDRKLLFERAPQ